MPNLEDLEKLLRKIFEDDSDITISQSIRVHNKNNGNESNLTLELYQDLHAICGFDPHKGLSEIALVEIYGDERK